MTEDRTWSVATKLGAVLVLGALLVGSLGVANVYLTRELIGASSSADYVGIQRMRVYKLAGLLDRTAMREMSAEDKAVIRQEVDLLDRELNSIGTGRTPLKLMTASDDDLWERLAGVQENWNRDLKPMVLSAAGTGTAGLSLQQQAAFQRLVPEFVASLSKIVDLIRVRLERRIRMIYGLQLFSMCLAVGLAVLAVVAVRRIVLVPLQHLSRGVQQVADNRTAVKIPLDSRDELGALARALESMGERLHSHIRFLEALNATGQVFSGLGHAGVEPVLRRTTDTAAALVGADLALLLVRHPTLDCWIIEGASHPHFDALHKHVLLFEETPFANKAFDTQEPVVVNDVGSQGGRPLLFRDRFGAKSYLVVPMLGAYEKIGVVVLMHTGLTKSYSERDIRLAQQSTIYATIALENARLVESATTESHVLREQLKAVERYIAELTHEVKAPAGRVSEFASWIERDYGDRLDERGLRYLQWIRKEGGDLAQLAGRSLDAARLLAGAQPLERVDTEAVVKEIVELYAEDCHARGIAVVLCGGFEPLACRRVHLKQILDNLVGNAVKYMGGQAHPEIRIGMEQNEHGVSLYVQDNGMGLEPEMIERIFLPFQRGEDAAIPGAGIGLTIVKTIVEHYGGTVEVSSKVGVGSTFHVRLPVAA